MTRHLPRLAPSAPATGPEAPTPGGRGSGSPPSAPVPEGGARPGVHPVVRAAAEGVLPEWAVAGPERRAHMERVARLLGAWADGLGLDADERVRWLAAGFLHDALRDEDPEALRDRVPPDARSLPAPLLHGPAAAERLRVDGVMDGELLRAVACHTSGHPCFGRLGRALFSADFLEPGRRFTGDLRAALRARMPTELDAVAREVLRARVAHLLERGRPVLPVTIAFWNRLLEEGR